MARSGAAAPAGAADGRDGASAGGARRVLVIKLGAFGDVLLADGALRDIRAAHPGAEIAVLTTPAYRRILEACPHVDRVLVDPRAPRWRLDRMAALRRRLRAFAPGMVYDLQNNARTAFYHRWMLRGTPWSGTAPGCSHPHRMANPKSVNARERHATQLADAGLAVRHARAPRPDWMIRDVSAVLAANGVVEPFIVLIPGSAARHPHKRWPGYAALAEALIAEGRRVVTVPGPDEVALCRSVPGVTLMDGERWLDWFELAGVLSRAAFVVGNDTGPSHLAAHLGVPGLALFGSHTPAERTGIRREGFDAIEVADLADLPVATVLDAVRRGLAGGPDPAGGRIS
ncbi:MAG: glycosyltransferase family 9 protein [Azospirillaceae bacterium]